MKLQQTRAGESLWEGVERVLDGASTEIAALARASGNRRAEQFAGAVAEMARVAGRLAR